MLSLLIVVLKCFEIIWKWHFLENNWYTPLHNDIMEQMFES